jgi:hypothetical protein
MGRSLPEIGTKRWRPFGVVLLWACAPISQASRESLVSSQECHGLPASLGWELLCFTLSSGADRPGGRNLISGVFRWVGPL